MVYQYMVPVYGLLVKAGVREIESLPKQYQVPVAEYLSAEVEKEK
ncbi:CD1375 family protein [Sporosarcina obsidiansis]|nr:CD1375 family protein [Sporosarcina obsidiansis]